MRNTIYLRHHRKVLLPSGTGVLPPGHLGAALKNIEGLGFTFSQALIEHIRTLPAEIFSDFYEHLVPALRNMTGAHVPFNPMYPNFPAQVMEMEQYELYINAITHYLIHHIPGSEPKERTPLLENVRLKVIDLGTDEEFTAIFTRLLRSKTSISGSDAEDLEWFVQEYRDAIEPLIPAEIPLKENLALLGALLMKHTTIAEGFLAGRFNTATDILRLAVALSGGDVSLATPARFRSFKRPERRLLLSMLEQCREITEDMLRYKGRWIRLGERLHPFEFRERFPNTCHAFDIVRNNRPLETFNSRLEQALLVGKAATAIELLQSRPGEFARRLDHLLRTAESWHDVLIAFNEVASRVSTPVLLQLLAHFKHRHHLKPFRTFFPKGDVGKAFSRANDLPVLSDDATSAVVEICRSALIARFAALPPLGRVYLDEGLKDYIVPFAQRSASKSLRTLVRGSRLTLPAGDTIRFFLWWKEGMVDGRHTGTVDIDLSAVMYDTEWRYVEHISYTNLVSKAYKAAHSGDIVTAPEGACEFIDIDIPSVVGYGGRYVVMSVNSFSQQAFCNLPECYAGWMMRQAPGSGEIFEPKTVQDRIDVTANTRICIPVILDLVERRTIWADLALTSRPRWSNNIEGNQKGMLLMGEAMTSLVKPTLYDLFELHIAARGIPSDMAMADTVFSVENGITPFDIPVIVGEYM